MSLLTARGLVLPAAGLAGVDLDLAAGELVTVTGDDGCGTSTLLRVLAGRQAPDAGTVTGAAALLPQPPGDDWADGDVAGTLADPAALRDLGMASPPEREMWMLSGGERQRVRLARALAADAPVLLLDEPLGYLDPLGVRTVLERLRARASDGGAVLLVAKAHPEAAAAADRVLELSGRLLSR